MIHKHNSFFIFVMWNLIIRLKEKKKKNRKAFLPAYERGKDPPVEGCPEWARGESWERGSPSLGRATASPADPAGTQAPASRPRSTYCWECQSAVLFLSLAIGEGDLHFLSQLAACTPNSKALQARDIDCRPVISAPAQRCKGFQIPSLGLSFSSSSSPLPRTQ